MSRTLPRKLAQVKPGTLFVGVDLGLDRNVAVIINEGGRRLAAGAAGESGSALNSGAVLIEPGRR